MTDATSTGAPAAAGVRLADLTTLRVGGPARRYVACRTEGDLIAAVAAADRRGEPLLVVGGGSNLLVGDAGFDGTVCHVLTRGFRTAEQCGAGRLTVAAGEPWDGVVERAVGAGLAGIEALSGIPGSAGATPIQNVGAYGQEIADVVESVRVWDRRAGGIRDMAARECRFGYRTSVFRDDAAAFIVLSVELNLARSRQGRPVRYGELARDLGVGVGDRAPLADVRTAVLRLRRGKGMVLDVADHDTWSAGSFFTNPVVDAAIADRLPADAPQFPVGGGRVKLSAAWLIGYAGFERGYGTGPAALSSKHTLAITNRGAATAQDVLHLARAVRDAVQERCGVVLAPEPTLVNCSL